MRIDGYLPLRDYAVIGDGRTTALIGKDGSIDWLCLPRPDSPPVLDRLLDAGAGGVFELAPEEPYEAVRRYREGTNVLETTFTTASGSVRVTDAMTRDADAEHELVRIVDGRGGEVALRGRFGPRYDFGRGEVPAELSLRTWDAGEGSFGLREGERATFALTWGAPATDRAEAERRVERTSAWWMDWSGRATYDGPWRDAVVRSALVLKLLAYEPTGAILAAPTTSLPERIGGGLNWDYRFSWLRDGIYTMRALLFLGYREEAEAFFRWQLRATAAEPDVRPLYRIDGSTSTREDEVDVPGYRGSRPVRVGNAADDQLQLDNYGHLLESASRLRAKTGSLGPDAGRQLAAFADAVVERWSRPDAGIWEVRGHEEHFVQSKALAWTALDRAAKLAEAGALPAANAARWRAEADAARAWIESEGWDEGRRSYRRAAGDGGLADASLLTLALCAYSGSSDARFVSTVDTLRHELGAGGPLLYRTSRSPDVEGAFLACSFWLVDALGRAGRTDEGHEVMGQLVELANDVGLYAEEIDPASGEFLGNFPQALVHLALVNAAVSLAGGADG